MKKDAIIHYLTKQLFASKSNFLKDEPNLQKDNTNEANKKKTAHENNFVPRAIMEILVSVK